MLTYSVSSLAGLHDAIAFIDATHVVSLIDPDMDAPNVPHAGGGRHTILRLHDVNRAFGDSGLVGDPSDDHARTLVDLGRSIRSSDRVAFHCVAGQSRSAAAALICDLAFRVARGVDLTPDLVRDAHATLIARRPQAAPNLVLLRIADKFMGGGGHLASFRPVRRLDLNGN